LLSAIKLRQYRSMGHLMPLAAIFVWAAPVALGVIAGVLVAVAQGIAFPQYVLLAAPAAWIVAALGAYACTVHASRRPVRVGLIGSSEATDALAGELRGSGVPGIELAGHIDSLDSLRETVIELRIDVLVCASEDGMDEATRAAADLLDLPVRLIEGHEAYEQALGHVPLAVASSAWFRDMLRPDFRRPSVTAGRLRDVVFVALMVPIALPILAISALAVLISSGAPVLHRQRRIGEGGREFTMTKLRSMRVENDPTHSWCVEDDPRVTPVGRFLRRTHIDELPQLWNVLRGDMALVGPRPEVGEVVDRLEVENPHYDRRHLVKPGLTGWAQVRCGYAGTELGSAWKLCFDLYYLKNRSATFDLLILIETLRVVAGGGQYEARQPDPRFVVSQVGGQVAAQI
jgi:lipopolysaccharide/colanic/teichoic acid biosynthesis glycosyltransferase